LLGSDHFFHCLDVGSTEGSLGEGGPVLFCSEPCDALVLRDTRFGAVLGVYSSHCLDASRSGAGTERPGSTVRESLDVWGGGSRGLHGGHRNLGHVGEGPKWSVPQRESLLRGQPIIWAGPPRLVERFPCGRRFTALLPLRSGALRNVTERFTGAMLSGTSQALSGIHCVWPWPFE
jgi:hypothetical protein